MSFTYRGTSSDTMKFNVTERQVYNAPAFDVNAIEVPGRDGDLLNSQNRFQNKTITYTGFLREQDFPGDTKRERLSRGLRELKAWICGDAGHYHDLTDDYDPGFIRRAYISGETAINEILDQPDGVTLTITFRAEPFMYLEGNPFNVPETGTKSGDIATFTGVAAPLQSLIFDINPVQDLHGYANPWPGGGGKNLINFPDIAQTTSNGVTYSMSGGVLSINGTATGGVVIYPTQAARASATYTMSAQLLSGSMSGTNSSFSVYSTGSTRRLLTFGNTGVTTKTTFTGDIVAANAGIVINSGAVFTNAKIAFQVEAGSDMTAFAPYSNISPISGWSQVDAAETGWNLWDEEWEVGTINTSTGQNQSYYSYFRSKNYIPVKGGQAIYINAQTNDSFYVWYYAADKSYIRYYSVPVSQIFTPPANAAYIRFVDLSRNNYNDDVCVNYSDASFNGRYVPYSGTPITIALGQTVYGGYVAALRGKLAITQVAVDLGTLTWARGNRNNANTGYIFNTNSVASTMKAEANAICSIFTQRKPRYSSWEALAVNTFQTEPTSRIVACAEYADAASFTAAMSGVQFVYELATPIEIDLTPVSVSSLLGVNNVWCNTGSTEVVYIDPTENPTGFASKPLWEITMSGAGNLTVNGKTWSIGAYTGTLYCDTDIMDWYNSSSLQNDLVSGSDFPELQPGENIIFYTGGITNVKVTPRWRAL